MSFEGEPFIDKKPRTPGKIPNFSIWVRMDEFKFLSSMRQKIIKQREFQGRVTYNDVIGKLIENYNGEFN